MVPIVVRGLRQPLDQVVGVGLDGGKGRLRYGYLTVYPLPSMHAENALL